MGWPALGGDVAGKARGFLIAVEGIDGAGKTTQAKRLVRWLRENGFEARYTREPTGGAVGRILKAMAHARSVNPYLEALLFAADRLQHLERTIEPLLSRGYVVVSDRYLHSSLAYQSATTGEPEWVRRINEFARKPDLALLLDVEPEAGLRRLRRRRSRFENPELLSRIRENYLDMARRGELAVVDAGRGVGEVFEDVKRVVARFLWERGAGRRIYLP